MKRVESALCRQGPLETDCPPTNAHPLSAAYAGRQSLAKVSCSVYEEALCVLMESMPDLLPSGSLYLPHVLFNQDKMRSGFARRESRVVAVHSLSYL